MSKHFVGGWLVAEIKSYHNTVKLPVTTADIKKINQFLYHKYPEMAKRTLRAATKAVREDNYRSDLAMGHFTALPKESIVPQAYSDYDYYIEQMKRIISNSKQNGTRIKLANIQDIHIESVTDNAILNLVFQVLTDFQPDYVPVMADLIDNVLLQEEMHGKSISEMEVESDLDPQTFFEEATYWYLDTLGDIVPDAIKPTWLGNHEWWLLRYFVKTGQNPAYFLKHFMKGFKKRGGLWLEGDKRTEIPITGSVIGVHGWLARTSTYGSTANGYMKHYNGDISVFAGHSHRPETVWSRPHPNTGGRNFVNICGTLGTIRPHYMKQRYIGHVHQFTLARLAPEGNMGHEIIEVPIHYAEGFYFCYVEGKKYQEQATSEPAWLNPLAHPELE